MHPPKLLLMLGLGACAATPLHAQSIGPSAIDVAGGSTTAGSIIHEYAIGQVVAGNTFTAADLIVTPGVLQPAFSTAGITPAPGMLADMQVYPSPVETMLYLQPAFSGKGTLQYSLYDAGGRQVLQQEAILISGQERQSLQVAAFPAGQYVLQVTWLQLGKTDVATYKVQKLH